jgi:hypothetical protein
MCTASWHTNGYAKKRFLLQQDMIF